MLPFLRSFLFQNNHLFAAVIFSQYLLFQSKTFTEQPLLEKRQFFRADTFRNTDFFGGETVSNKEIFRRGPFSNEELLRNFFRRVTFWKKLIFQKSNIPHCLLFLDSYFFRVATFSEHTFFRKLLLQFVYIS